MMHASVPLGRRRRASWLLWVLVLALAAQRILATTTTRTTRTTGGQSADDSQEPDQGTGSSDLWRWASKNLKTQKGQSPERTATSLRDRLLNLLGYSRSNDCYDLSQSMLKQVAWGGNMTETAWRALAVATYYIWSLVPVKVQFFRNHKPDSRAAALYSESAWPAEVKMLQYFRQAGANFTVVAARHRTAEAPHSFCDSGWWKTAALADCRDSVAGILRDRGSAELVLASATGDAEGQTGISTRDILPRVASELEHATSWYASGYLVRNRCLSDDLQYHMACAYSDLVRLDILSLERAAQHLEITATALLLCSGCRSDGLGFHSLALDEVLWSFGILVAEILAMKGQQQRQFSSTKAQGPSRQRLLSAAVDAASVPVRSHWRGTPRQAQMYGRPQGCSAVLRAPICASGGSVFSGDPALKGGSLVMPSCHYERQRWNSRGLQVFPMLPEAAAAAAAGIGPGACEAADPDVVLLMVPTYHWLEQHLTSNMIWFLGTLAWFHGPSGMLLLQALWSLAGLPDPPAHLLPNTTELLMLTLPRKERLDTQKLLLYDLLGLLSHRPVQSLPPATSEISLEDLGNGIHSCRCYRRAA
ncbi:unnamed protein product, partial [Polarella glacialis]